MKGEAGGKAALYEVFVAIPANSLVVDRPGEYGDSIFTSTDREAAIRMAEAFLQEQSPKNYTIQVRHAGKVVWMREGLPGED